MLRAPDLKAPGGTWAIDCTLAGDGSWYVCRYGSGDGVIVRGRKIEDRLPAAPMPGGLLQKGEAALAMKPEMNPLPGQIPVTEESLREGLVLHFTFDQAEDGGKVTDESGKGNHGQAAGVVWTANSK